MALVISCLSGVLFALGLVISGMTNPEKVIGFLDILGNWDYSLAFVMGGAVGINLFAFKFVMKRKPFYADKHLLPTRKDVDAKLIVGAVLFGAGWGLLGMCPGPALVNIATLDANVFVFVGAMVGGIFLFKIYSRLTS